MCAGHGYQVPQRFKEGVPHPLAPSLVCIRETFGTLTTQTNPNPDLNPFLFPVAPTQPLKGCSCFCPAPKSSDTSIPKPQPQLCLMLSMDVKLEPGGSKPALPHFAFLIVKKKKKDRNPVCFRDSICGQRFGHISSSFLLF